MIKKIVLTIASVLILSAPILVKAQSDSNVSWKIKQFDTEITLNKDSSIDVTEKITADFGVSPKHGIFRVLPTQYTESGTKYKTPIVLQSITDVDDNPIKYETTNDWANKTVTWKIGDKDITLSGTNSYKIRYKVKNAVISGNENIDRFHWNLLGNYWEAPVESFTAKVIFPVEIQSRDSKLDYFGGLKDETKRDLATVSWTDGHTLLANSTRELAPNEGFTIQNDFKKGVITPYAPTFWEKYGLFIWLIVPLLVFGLCFNYWKKYGRDSKADKTIIPEYDPPKDLTPFELGLLLHGSAFKSESLTAEIISLAVKKHLQIVEVPKNGFFGHKDYKLVKLADQNRVDQMPTVDQVLIGKIFPAATPFGLSLLKNSNLENLDHEILLSDLKKFLPKSLEEIKQAGKSNLIAKNLFEPTGFKYQTGMMVFGIVLICASFLFMGASIPAFIAAILSGAICLIFSFLMPQTSKEGAEIIWRAKGFKLFMDVAEKYRERFNEKENIFEKFLPYAILFGITKEWAQKMRLIYGDEYFMHYHPIWYAGDFSNGFDFDSFTNSMSEISNSVAAGTSTGSSGSGGGGGGGGGGAW